MRGWRAFSATRRDAIQRAPVRFHEAEVTVHLPADAVSQYRESTHGRLLAQGSPDAPTCANPQPPWTLGKNDSASPTFSRNIPRSAAVATGRQQGCTTLQRQADHVVEHYTDSIHGKGLLQSGLTSPLTV